MKKISLRPYNSFGVDAYAKDFVSVESEKEIVEFLEKNKNKSLLILGGGTNILFKKDVDYPVLKIDINGIEIINEAVFIIEELSNRLNIPIDYYEEVYSNYTLNDKSIKLDTSFLNPSRVCKVEKLNAI